MILFKTDTLEQIRPPSSDERRAQWSAKFYAAGYHRIPNKPRVRLQPTTERAGRIVAGKEPQP